MNTGPTPDKVAGLAVVNVSRAMAAMEVQPSKVKLLKSSVQVWSIAPNEQAIRVWDSLVCARHTTPHARRGTETHASRCPRTGNETRVVDTPAGASASNHLTPRQTVCERVCGSWLHMIYTVVYDSIVWSLA